MTIEWDVDATDDDGVLKLGVGCMDFEIDLETPSVTMTTDLPSSEKARLFCERVAELFNEIDWYGEKDEHEPCARCGEQPQKCECTGGWHDPHEGSDRIPIGG